MKIDALGQEKLPYLSIPRAIQGSKRLTIWIWTNLGYQALPVGIILLLLQI